MCVALFAGSAATGGIGLLPRDPTQAAQHLSKVHNSLYLAEFSDADRVTEGGGLAEEGEVLEVVEITLRDLAAMADRGALPELKVFALVMTLRVQRPELFA